METDDKIDDKITDAEVNTSQVNVENVRDNNEDMEDDDSESKLEETKQFVSLFSKAEKMNQKKMEHQQRQQQPLQSSSWRDLGNPDDDDSDETEDEDDPEETNKFLSMIKSKKKKNLVNIRWVNGKVCVTPVSEDADVADHLDPDDARALPDSVTVTRVGAGECLPGARARPAIPDTVTITRVPGPDMVSGQDISQPGPRLPCFNITRAPAPQPLECVRRQREAETRESRDNKKGKRKFEDRMTLTEAKMTDFEDSRDYVDFLQSKLQGVNIKIVK